MKILYVVHQFFPKHYTGTERLTLNLSHQMQRSGHSAKVLTYGITEEVGFRQEAGLLIKEYDYQGVPVISVRHKNIPEEISFRIHDPTMVKAFERILSTEKPDVIHVTHTMRGGIITKVAKDMGIPIVLTLTDFWLFCPRGIGLLPDGRLCITPDEGKKCVKDCYGGSTTFSEKLLRRFDETKEVFRNADCVVCATDFLKGIYNNLGFSPIRIVRFGKDYRNVRPNLRRYRKNSKICLVSLSTLLPHKGAHVLLDAYNKANAENISLKIYGHYHDDKGYYNKLLGMANKNPKIEFLGPYRYEDMADILDNADLLVVPSIWWENSPLVLLRALAHKVPAIVSDLGGMTEVVEDGANGFTFKVGDADSLSEILQRIGSDPSILNAMKAKIRSPPRIEEEAFEYEKIYLELIKEGIHD